MTRRRAVTVADMKRAARARDRESALNHPTRLYDDGCHGLPICGRHLAVALRRIDTPTARELFGDCWDDAADTLSSLRPSDFAAECGCCNGTCNGEDGCLACVVKPSRLSF